MPLRAAYIPRLWCEGGGGGKCREGAGEERKEEGQGKEERKTEGGESSDKMVCRDITKKQL